ncbi:MAG: hypothetical protein M0R46_17745 [Candidatus Muirbacterium halophilum]|nr:hypothetical protein [Candidatus Muirbacterium halophilum]
MKLSDWAKKQGVSYLTTLRWYHAGKIKNAIQIDTGTILVNENRNFDDKTKKVRICLYGRVSNNNRKQELNYQIDRLINFTNSRGSEFVSIKLKLI